MQENTVSVSGQNKVHASSSAQQVSLVKFIALERQMDLNEVTKMLRARNLTWAPIEVAQEAVKSRLADSGLSTVVCRETKCVTWSDGKKFRYISKGYFKKAGGNEKFDRNDIIVAMPARLVN